MRFRIEVKCVAFLSLEQLNMIEKYCFWTGLSATSELPICHCTAKKVVRSIGVFMMPLKLANNMKSAKVSQYQIEINSYPADKNILNQP